MSIYSVFLEDSRPTKFNEDRPGFSNTYIEHSY